MDDKENSHKIKVLFIEDEEYFRKHICTIINKYCEITEVSNAPKAIELISNRAFDIVIIDINLHGKNDGFSILEQAKKRGLFSIILTGNESDEFIKKAYKIGCNHYLTKDQCETVIEWIIKERTNVAKNILSNTFFEQEYITGNESLINEIKSIKQRMHGDKPILILGETGTGKTKIAAHLHKISGGNPENFVSLNVSAIPENLIESELFGYVKGSFTGADKDKKGLLQMADNGTFFLDEITSIPLMIQKKLLKVMEEKFFYLIGGVHPTKTKFRLISSTCEDIYKLIQENKFRIDLFYRINGIILTIPPLRERKDDIALLINHFMKKCSRRVHIDDKAFTRLINYPWPGNIRELKKVVEGLSLKENGTITDKDLEKELNSNKDEFTNIKRKKLIQEEHLNYAHKFGFKAFFNRIQNELILETLKVFRDSHKKSRTALQMSKSCFYHMNQRAKENKQNNQEEYMELLQ